jgi:hypothetical protein
MMEAAKDHPRQPARRGRPRTRKPSTELVRRNLLLDPLSLQKLCDLYQTKNASEAVRRAIDLALLDEATESLRALLAERGGPIDAYGPPTPLPVYLGPDDVVDFDDEDTP